MKTRCFFANKTTGKRCLLSAQHMRKDPRNQSRVYLVCKRHTSGSRPVRSSISRVRALKMLQIIRKTKPRVKKRSRKARVKSLLTNNPFTVSMMAAQTMPVAGVVSTRDLRTMNEMRLPGPYDAIVMPKVSQRLKTIRKKTQPQQFKTVTTRRGQRAATKSFPTFAALCNCGDY